MKATYADLLELDPASPFPFWAKVWPSSIALLKLLQKHPSWIKNKTVLELGAGIGLASLMMANEAKAIQVSDYNLEAVELLQKLIEKFIHKGCTIILSTPQSIMASPFILALSTYFIADYVELVDENGVTKEISILLLSDSMIKLHLNKKKHVAFS